MPMKKSVLAAAVFFACASSLRAQIEAGIQRLSTGAPEVRIRNKAAVSLTAFAVALNPSREAEDQTQLVLFFDAVADQAAPLEPDQERAVPLFLRSRPGKPIEDLFALPVISAGILADGTTAGDAVLLLRLMTRRSNMLLALETTLEILSDAGRRNIERKQLIEQFRKLADSVWRWYVPPEQQVGRSLYQSLMDKLKNVPEGPLGSPFPPTAFVAEETAALNRRRVALLEAQPSLAKATLLHLR